MPAASTWTPECLQRAVDEVRALSCMFGDGASPAEDPTDVSHHESLLELAESALDAAEASAGSTPGENTLHAVPALEITIKLLGVVFATPASALGGPHGPQQVRPTCFLN